MGRDSPTRHVGNNHRATGMTEKLWALLVWWQPQPHNREPVTVTGSTGHVFPGVRPTRPGLGRWN